MKKILFYLAAIVFVSIIVKLGYAYTVPEQDSHVKYLYIFGPEGDKYDGADTQENSEVLYIDVPQGEENSLVISVYDPDTGGFRDQKPGPDRPWDTTVEFAVAVYGEGDRLLDKKQFGESPEYDRKYYTFGPYPKETGSRIGDVYRFKLVANAIAGEDQNLFKVRISPDSAESFSYKVSFRMLPHEGDKMFFYPGIPAGVDEIIIENYDIDKDGGKVELYDHIFRKRYKIENSESGEWAQTVVDIDPYAQPRRLEYLITKKTQRYANAIVRVKDERGNPLPIYFRAGKYSMVVPEPEPEAPEPVVFEAKPEATGAKCNNFTFDATKSYDPDNEELSYLWDFGDGTTSTEPVVTHIYKKGGIYNVRLTVKDYSGLTCDTSVTTQTIKVNTPPEPSFLAPDIACVDKEIIFDASATYDDTQNELSFRWDFGDGTSAEGRQAAKQYKKGGTYNVKLVVNDNTGSPCSMATLQKTIVINAAPFADAGRDVDMCLSSEEDYQVVLDAGRSGDVEGNELEYYWDFGDNTSSSGKTVTHKYQKGGTYTAKLMVDDGSKSDCSSCADAITVKLNKQPIADAGGNVVTCVGLEAVFDGSRSRDSDGDILNYSWNFGDGTTAQGIKARHAYTKTGNYKAALMVDDGNGTQCSKNTDSINVFVNRPPSVVFGEVAPVCIGRNVRFDISGGGKADADFKYIWDFGDGTALENGPSVTHVYEKGGTYVCRATVDDGFGSPCSVNSSTTTIYVNTPPVADAGPNLVCCVGEESVFEGASSRDADGDELTYIWDFGDGHSAQGVRVTHVYSKGGTYNVTLKVDDNSKTSCSTSQSSFQARVNDQPVAVIQYR